MDAEHLGGERGLARGIHAGVAIAAHQAEERVSLAHPGPGQVPRQQGAGELADGRAMALGPAGQALDVAQGVDGFVDGEIGAIEGALAGRDAGVDLDADRAGVEADGGGVGARPQGVADILGRQRVQPVGHLGMLVARDLGLAPERDVVGRGGGRAQGRLLDGLEVLARGAQRPTVAPQAIVLAAPPHGMHARLGKIEHHLPAEAVVADGRHGALHAGLVPRAPHARGVDDEAARLGVLQEGGGEPRLEGIRALDDRLRVVGDQDAEDAVEERPGGFTGLDRRLGGFAEHRVDEPVAGQNRREDPRPEAPTSALRVGRQMRHPAGVELDLLARATVGEWDRRRGTPPAELLQGEAPQRGVTDRHALAPEQRADLGQPHVGAHEPLDDPAVGRARGPAVAMGAPRARLDGADDRGEQAVVQCVGIGGDRQPVRLRGAQVPPDRLDVQAQLGGDPLLADTGHPEPQDLFDLQHRDLAIGHVPLRAQRGPRGS